jgi:carbamoyl-phosphate synthase large subunit
MPYKEGIKLVWYMSSNDVVVVVTGVGSTIGLGIAKALRMINGFDDLGSSNKNGTGRIRIVGVDANPLAVGLYCLDASYLVPLGSHDFTTYFDALVDVCKREQAAILLSGWDGELIPLGERHEDFFNLSETRLGHRVMGIREASDKWLTYLVLNENNIPTPHTVLPEDKEGLYQLFNTCKPPYIVKPRQGSGSRGLFKVCTIEEVRFFSNYLKDIVVQEEILPADEEYTIGVFMLSEGEAVGTMILKRSLMSGLSYRMQVFEDAELSECAIQAVKALGLVGAANVQLRRTKDGPKVFEINPRFSSSTSVRAHFGFNEPEMAIRYFYHNERPILNEQRKGYALRYWEEMFLDSDSVERARKGSFDSGYARGLVRGREGDDSSL